MHSNIICIDLDGVVLNFSWDAWIKRDMKYFGTPIKGVRQALKKLKRMGYKILIYSSRLTPSVHSDYTFEELYLKVKNVLTKNDIPHDEIWMEIGKPIADYYVDDRAIHFQSWKQVLEQVKSDEF